MHVYSTGQFDYSKNVYYVLAKLGSNVISAYKSTLNSIDFQNSNFKFHFSFPPLIKFVSLLFKIYNKNFI